MLKLIKLLLLVSCLTLVACQSDLTEEYDLVSTSEPEIIDTTATPATTTTTTTVSPSISRRARTTSTPLTTSTTTAQPEENVMTTLKPSTESSEISVENDSEVKTEDDRVTDVTTIRPKSNSTEKPSNEPVTILTTNRPTESSDKKVESDLTIRMTTTTMSPLSFTENNHENSYDKELKDSPDNRESRANSALLDKLKSNSGEDTDDEGKNTSPKGDETSRSNGSPELTDNFSFDSFDDLDSDNFTLPPFEVNPIVDFFGANDSYYNEQPSSNTSKEFNYSSSGSGGLLARLFQGPDRSKLPVNSKPEDIYRYLSAVFDNETSIIGKSILPHIVELGYKVNIDQKCAKSILAIRSGVKAKRTWAFRFLDSFGRRGDGFLAGTLGSLGNFDECIGIRATDDSILLEEDEFTGKYCLAHIRPPLPEPIKTRRMTFKDPILNYAGTELENTYIEHWGSFAHELYSNSYVMGMCIPSTCQSKDIAKILNELATPFNFTVTFNSRCAPETNYWEAPSPPEYALFILAFLGLMVGFGTAYDLYIRKKEENCLGRLFAAFSALANTRALAGKKKMDSKKGKLARERQLMAGQSLSWIHGLQFLSVCWIIIANVYQLGGLPVTFLLKNLNMDYRSQGGSVLFQFILNSWDYMAELFFLLSGFIFCLGLLAARERKRCPTFGRFMIRQWLSYAPSIICSILITLIIFQWSWQSGPLFSKAEKLIVEPCIKNGIANIFLFNNWLSTQEMCLPHTWFLSALFQLQIIGFLVIMIIHRRPSLGVTLSVLLILLGIILPGFLTYQYNLPPTMLINDPNIKQIRDDLSTQYFPTYNHLSSFFVGVLLAYVIYKKPAKPTINKGIRLAIWLVFGAISLSSILITYKWNGFEEIPNQISSIIYSSLHRIAFISFFVWLIHQFTFKQGGIIARFLSWKTFRTLNGLSLQIYLIHLIIIWNYYLTRRSLIDYRNSELTIISFGIILISLIVGYFVYLVVEAPFHQISAGFVKCLFGCDLKSRLREYENEVDSEAAHDMGDEKKTAPEESINTVDGCPASTLGNNDVRIEISAPIDGNRQEKESVESKTDDSDKSDKSDNSDKSVKSDKPEQEQPRPQQQQQPQVQQQPAQPVQGINNNGVVIRL